MEKKAKKVLEQAIKIYGDDTDILIIAHNNGQCTSALHGNGEKIADALFSCMQNTNGPIAGEIYRILRLNVMNILYNPSPYAMNLMETIINMVPPQNSDDEPVKAKEIDINGK